MSNFSFLFAMKMFKIETKLYDIHLNSKLYLSRIRTSIARVLRYKAIYAIITKE